MLDLHCTASCVPRPVLHPDAHWSRRGCHSGLRVPVGPKSGSRIFAAVVETQAVCAELLPVSTRFAERQAEGRLSNE